MRRVWAFIVASILFGLMAWNFLTGQSVLDIKIIAASLVTIAFTVTWWFETSEHK